MKYCKRCQQDKDESEFGVWRHGSGRLRNICKKCNSEQALEWYRKNFEKIRKKRAEVSLAWHRAHPERKRKYNRKYYLRARERPGYYEKCRERQKAYYYRHKDKIQERNRLYRERKKAESTNDLSGM